MCKGSNPPETKCAEMKISIFGGPFFFLIQDLVQKRKCVYWGELLKNRLL